MIQWTWNNGLKNKLSLLNKRLISMGQLQAKNKISRIRMMLKVKFQQKMNKK